MVCLFRTAVLLLAIALPWAAHGQRANYENVVFGEASTGMSSASIGLATEASSVFFNPGGLARVPYDVLSISVQAIGATQTTATEFLRRGDETALAESTVLGVFPTSVVYSIPFGGKEGVQHRLGLSVVVPNSHEYAFSQSLTDRGGNRFAATVTLSEVEYLAGVTYALGLGRLSLGATAFAQYASLAYTNLLSATDHSSADVLRQLTRGRRSAGTQVGMTGIFGAHLQLSETWSLGLRVRLPNLALYDSAEHTFSETDAVRTAGVWSVGHVSVGGLEGGVSFPHPLGFGLGLAYRSRRLTLALDAKAYLPMDGYTLLDGPVQSSPDTRSWDPAVRLEERRAVINFAFGGEVFLTESLSFLFGLNTDASGEPSSSTGDVDIDSTMSFIGVATGIRHTSLAGTFTASMSFRHGVGSIGSIEWRDDFVAGVPDEVRQSSGFVTISWSRSLTENWVELQRSLRELAGESAE